ncbi:MAG: thiamine pyrophosphate-binding protein [Gammaproteobacteria bacterium]|nr:thiamine pyrophosphate-binding protein [Gammaproteobacteria bacterium]
MQTTKRLFEEDVSVPEAIVRVLEEAGIDMIFGIIGGNMGRIYNALYDHQATIRAVLVRHESLASVMAEVYGRLTGKPGVAIGQGGFMLANGLLGTIEAHLGSSPMLVLSELSDQAPFSQHAPYQGGTGEYGTFDGRQSFSGVTKYTIVPHEAVQAVQSTQLAIKHAMSGEPGPVAVLYHSTSLNGHVGPDSIPTLYPTGFYLPRKPHGETGSIVAVARALMDAERPVIIAGNGVRLSQAYGELANLAELLVIPVATTASGKSTFPETHELALGVCGNFGQTTANKFIGQADLILAVGTKLGTADNVAENPEMIDPERQVLLQIDIDPLNSSWIYPCAEVITGDATIVLTRLAEVIGEMGEPAEEKLSQRKEMLNAARREHGFFSDPGYDSDETPILPQRLIAEIHKAITDDTIIACDAGENRLFMTHYFQTKSAGSLIMPGFGAMGYAIPAALAAKLIHPDRPVIAVCGDGGFGMAMQGLMTALDENIPIAVVVMNNSALGWVKHGQGNRVIASTFSDMNYADIATAMGCKGIRVEKPEQLPAALAAALEGKEPVVVDVVTSLRTSFRDVSSPLLRRS